MNDNGEYTGDGEYGIDWVWEDDYEHEIIPDPHHAGGTAYAIEKLDGTYCGHVVLYDFTDYAEVVTRVQDASPFDFPRGCEGVQVLSSPFGCSDEPEALYTLIDATSETVICILTLSHH